MQARLTAYPHDSAALAMTIGPGDALRIGRAGDSTLRIDHASISRAHAELVVGDTTCVLRDLGSKNGTFVDGTATVQSTLDHACWLRFGDVFCEFAPLTDADVAATASGQRARRAAATAHTARLDGLQRMDDLLDASLRGVLDLSQCERGFVLLDSAEGMRVGASLALDPHRLAAREFTGSVGAVQRALARRTSVVVNDIGSDAWLAGRASVASAGLSALACLPLLDGGDVLGVIYVDRVRPGPAITTLDLDLLEAFVERAALWLSARRARARLDTPSGEPLDWSRIITAHRAAGVGADA